VKGRGKVDELRVTADREKRDAKAKTKNKSGGVFF